MLIVVSRVAEEVADARYGPDKEDRQDMIGSFIRHGLNKPQLEIEIFSQMYFPWPTCPGM